jgi:two-component system cell cycle response regulator
LICDDDDSTRARLAAQFTLTGYEVETATCTAEALSVQATAACQIIVAAGRRPAIDGPTLCRRLRDSERHSYVYLVILAASMSAMDTLTGLAAGADDCICKDVSAEELMARINVGRRIMRHENALRAGFQESQRLSITDPLTGTYNRRYLMRYLPFELARSRRYCHPLAVLCCDLDWFKRVNDRFGHEAGDDVLRQFVSRSHNCLRGSIDWIARSGGEEFVIVMPETGLGGAISVADKLRRALAGEPIPTCAGPLIVTVSVGATALETPIELERASVTEVLRAADRCLYLSKRLGRDRVTALPVSRAAALDLDGFGRKQHEIN